MLLMTMILQAASPGPVLNAIPLTELDEKSQTQVTAFLNKISAFPTKMSAVKITTISTTFLASVRVIIQLPLLIHPVFPTAQVSRDNLPTSSRVQSNPIEATL
jgi:hypothetical protein